MVVYITKTVGSMPNPRGFSFIAQVLFRTDSIMPVKGCEKNIIDLGQIKEYNGDLSAYAESLSYYGSGICGAGSAILSWK